MILEQCLRFMYSQPFEPFFIRTNDGREHLVRHQEEITVSAGGATVLITHPTSQFECIDMALVVSLKTAGPVDPDEYDPSRRSPIDPENEG